MNTKEASKRLINIFCDFKLHRLFVDEIRKLLKKELSGKENLFFNVLITQLNNIRMFGKLINTVDSHEKLKGLDGHYYSIHLQQSQFNIRFLVYITDDNEVYFLSAFYERAGKKRTNYSTYTSVLLQRYNELLGDVNDGK